MGTIYKINDKLYISPYRTSKKIEKLKKEGIIAKVALIEKKIKNLSLVEFDYLFKLIENKIYIAS